MEQGSDSLPAFFHLSFKKTVRRASASVDEILDFQLLAGSSSSSISLVFTARARTLKRERHRGNSRQPRSSSNRLFPPFWAAVSDLGVAVARARTRVCGGHKLEISDHARHKEGLTKEKGTIVNPWPHQVNQEKIREVRRRQAVIEDLLSSFLLLTFN